MPRAVSRVTPVRRGRGRNRHGRGLRSSVTGPELPPLRTRLDFFELAVLEAADYVRALWPAELAGVGIRIASTPPGPPSIGGVDRWHVDLPARHIVLYRVPIERLAHLHKDDEWHRRSFIEACVFRAVAEFLGRDPWEIAPERYRHF